jgi:hypothetical protein
MAAGDEMMTPIRRLALAATFAMTLSLGLASVSAQDAADKQQGGGGRGNRGGPGGGGPGGRGGFGGGPGGQNADLMFLIQDPAVQEELKIEPKQLAQVTEVKTRVDKERGEAFQKMRANRANRNNNQANGNADPNADPNAVQGGGNGGPPDFTAMREQMEAMQKSGEAALAKVLTAKQRKRLTEIALQVRGPMAVADPAIADKLLMDEEQREAVKEIADNKRQAQGEIWRTAFAGFGGRGGPGGRGQGGQPGQGGPGQGGQAGVRPPVDPVVQQQRMEAMQKIQEQTQSLDKDAIKALGRVLNKRQKTAFDKMMGEPFDLTKLRGRGPGGPGRPADQAKAATAKADPAATKDQAASVTATKPAATRKGSLSARRKSSAN